MINGLVGLSITIIAVAVFFTGIAAVVLAVVLIRLTPVRHISRLRIIFAVILIASLLGAAAVFLSLTTPLPASPANISSEPTGGPSVGPSVIIVIKEVAQEKTPLDQILALVPLFSVVLSAVGLVLSYRSRVS